jgi:hypothetical protein
LIRLGGAEIAQGPAIATESVFVCTARTFPDRPTTTGVSGAAADSAIVASQAALRAAVWVIVPEPLLRGDLDA